MSGSFSAAPIVSFDFTTWATRYPELASIGQPLAQAYWNEATLYVDASGGGPVTDAVQLGVLLNMVTAHIAALNMPGSSPLVGRIKDASEGSVHVSADYATATPGSQAWFVQTKYGAAYWQATAQYRRFVYMQGPQPRFGARPWR